MVRTATNAGVIARNGVTKKPGSVRLFALAATLYLPSAFAADIPVYDATQVAFGSYTIVKRIWTGEWISAFWVPRSPDVDSARRAVINRAAAAGADAVVNLVCMDRTDAMFRRGGAYCYGDAIKANAPKAPEPVGTATPGG